MRGTINICEICETRCIHSVAAAGLIAVLLLSGSALTSAQGAEPSTESVGSVAIEHEVDARAEGRGRLLPAILAAAAEEEFERCGGRIKPEDEPFLRERQEQGVYNLPPGAASGSFTIPVTHHIIRRSNGSGGLPASAISAQMAGANDVWAGSGIQFCQWGPIRYIDSNFWFSAQINGQLMDTLRTVNVVPNTINVYWVPNFDWCGYSAFTWSASQGIVMKNSCSGMSPPAVGVFAHELGHYFDLLHTHETAAGEECTSGEDCNSTGDLVCDTPADPGLALGAWVNSDCQYTGDHDPPCDGDPPYNPLGDNMMSYSSTTCLQQLTPGQIMRANATLINLRPELQVLGGCGGASACGSGAGNCFSSNGTPGCENATCCATICAGDPFCCNSSWDSLCAAQATDMCQSGNTCELAVATSDGVLPSQSLLGYSASGASSSCSSASAIDRWYAYTASCTGTATVSLCTEFIVDDVAISVFEGCGDSNIACSSTPGPNCTLTDENASVSWEATSGATYLVRVSAIQSEPSSFSGAISFECEGCGAPGSGDCFSSGTGTPYCEDVSCCVYMCTADPFCCNTQWDSLCADQATADCTQECGSPIVGSCFESNGTPHCDRENCCNSICAGDPFCCDTNWDALCANAAATNTVACNVFEIDGVHFLPLGDALLTGIAGGVMVGDIGTSGDDGVQLNLDPDLIGLVGSINGVVAPMFLEEQSSLDVSVFTTQTSNLEPAATLSVLNTPQQTAEILIGLNIGSNTHRVQVYDGTTLVFENTGVFGEFVAGINGAVTPSNFHASVESNEVTLSAGFDEQIEFFMAPQFLPAVQGDRLVITSEQLQSSGGVAQPLGTIHRVQVRAAGMADFDLHDVTVGPPFTCHGDIDGSGVVNVDDLLVVLNNWGLCGSPVNCPADVTGTNVVNVDDLLVVLNNWGACP